MFNSEFYPTPATVIRKMLDGVKFDNISTVLEPSAGKGDIVAAVVEKFKYNSYSRGRENYDIDTIEIDANLRHILKGKGYRIIHDDFLTLETMKSYDLIVLNPPFSTGDKHLLKALEMQQHGGQVVCLLNAETLKNPYTNTRKDLARKLDEYNAKIEFIDGAFAAAERQTDVEIALVNIKIPEAPKSSVILAGLKREECHDQEPHPAANQVTHADFFQRIVAQYNNEVKAGSRLINEYFALVPHILKSLKAESCHKGDPIISLQIDKESHKCPKDMANAYIKLVRYKYWEALFASDEFAKLFTSDLRREYHEKIKSLQDYDFSLYNIAQIRAELGRTMTKSVEDAIIKLFDEFSHRYHWYNETSKNIHFYNGWATNKAWKINRKVIIPLSAFNDWSNRYEPKTWRVFDKLSDVEKVFNYLDTGITPDHINLRNALDDADRHGQTSKIETKYFRVTFYKKGTCHLEFKDLDLLKKFNLFGSQRKGWLPPTYGKKRYQEMTPEEKAVVNEFDGSAAEYEKVLARKDYFICQFSDVLQIAS